MRAVLRAVLAARRRARPTAAENSLLVMKFGFSFHCDLSNNLGVLPELSHTLPGVREKTIMVLKIILAPREAPEHNVQ